MKKYENPWGNRICLFVITAIGILLVFCFQERTLDQTYEVNTNTYEITQIKESVTNPKKDSYLQITYPYLQIYDNPKLSEQWNEQVYQLAERGKATAVKESEHINLKTTYSIIDSDDQTLSVLFQETIDGEQYEYGLVLSLKDGSITNRNDLGEADK